MDVGVQLFQKAKMTTARDPNARADDHPVALRKCNPNLSAQTEEIVLHAMEARRPDAIQRRDGDVLSFLLKPASLFDFASSN